MFLDNCIHSCRYWFVPDCFSTSTFLPLAHLLPGCGDGEVLHTNMRSQSWRQIAAAVLGSAVAGTRAQTGPSTDLGSLLSAQKNLTTFYGLIQVRGATYWAIIFNLGSWTRWRSQLPFCGKSQLFFGSTWYSLASYQLTLKTLYTIFGLLEIKYFWFSECGGSVIYGTKK